LPCLPADSKAAVVDIPIQFEIKGSKDGIIISDVYEFVLIEDYLSEDTEIAVSLNEQWNMMITGLPEIHDLDKSFLFHGHKQLQPEIGAGCVGLPETDEFQKLVGKMSILSAPKVGFNVEIVEQFEGTNILYTHRVCFTHFANRHKWHDK
jgi:hypothetical protein